jgi:hypothetical protein
MSCPAAGRRFSFKVIPSPLVRPCRADRGPNALVAVLLHRPNDVGGLTTAHLILLSSSPSSPCSLLRTVHKADLQTPLGHLWRGAARFRKRAGLWVRDAGPVLSAADGLARGWNSGVFNSDNVLQVRPEAMGESRCRRRRRPNKPRFSRHFLRLSLGDRSIVRRLAHAAQHCRWQEFCQICWLFDLATVSFSHRRHSDDPAFG